MSRKLCIGILIAIVVACAAPPLFADYIDIDTWTELQAINPASSSGNTYRLTRNLTTADSDYTTIVSGVSEGFTPIGNNTVQFAGVFDGQGHTIDGLYINRPGGSMSNYTGLFGYTSDPSLITNVGLVNVDITGGYMTGGLVGHSYGDVTNSFTTGIVRGSASYIYGTAGLVGNLSYGRVSDCFSEADVTAFATGMGASNTGGLVGQVGGTNSLIENSYATGTLSVMSNYSGNTGGLVGCINGNAATVENSFSTGSATGLNGASTGGLVGRNGSGILTAGGWYTGAGGAAWALGDNHATQVPYATANLSELFNPSDPDMAGLYSTWDFENTWIARENEAPVLAWVMQNWITMGSAGLGLSLAAQDVTTLLDFYKLKDAVATTSVAGLTWKYLSAALLPGDDGSKSYGESWTYDGKSYIKLGSGLEGSSGTPDPPPTGGETPEPATIVGLGLVALAVLKRKLRRA